MGPRQSTDQFVTLVRDLLALPRETTWIEDKVDNDDPSMIGERLSALANSAALDDRPRGYLIWGVRDGDRSLAGTAFRPYETKVGNEDLENWLLRLLTPQIFFMFHEMVLDDTKIVVLEVGRATSQPVKFKGVEYVRVGSYTKKLHDHPDHERRLWRVFERSSFEECGALEHATSAEALSLLDYPSYFDLMEVPLPEGRTGILDALASDRLIMPLHADSWAVSNLGAALFARHLDQFPSLRRKAVRVIQYRGSSRLETVKEQVETRGYANGFESLVSYISNLLPSNEVVGQALRRTVRMYPDLALRELVANALIH
jgi:ATP-dependent DNA helicase RecG